MPSLSHLATCIALTVSLLGAPALAAPFGGERVRAELLTIRQLAQRSTQEALARLEALRAGLGEDLPYDLRQQVLRTEVGLREDSGQLDQAYAVERTVLALALAHRDKATAARARLGEVRRLLDQNRPNDAQAALDRVLAQVPNDAPVVLNVAIQTVQGDIFNNKARFDKALAAYLQAMELLQGAPDAGDQRALLHARIAQVYVNSDHPVKAVESTQQGLAETGVPTATMGSLYFTRGLALIRVDRNEDGLAAFQRALAIARQARLAGLEAAIRGNIADFFLRQKDYPRAEIESRQALAASDKVKDQGLAMMAKANLGFALMGQGRIAAGTPYTDEVIAQLREAGATADLEGMLDEKGHMLEQAGQYKGALATVREQQTLQLGSARTARDRAIAALQEQFDANERTRKIALLQRENQLKDAELGSRRTAQIATTFAAVLTVLAGAAVFALYRRTARSNAQLKQLNTQLEFHSTRDALTGLHNRRSFLDRMRTRAEHGKDDRRATTAQGVDCFVLMDIDHFKNINDRWGHGVGDAVLVETARRMTSAVRDTDMVLRWGGEEFMIYAPGTDTEHVATLVKRVLDAVGSSPVDAHACKVPVTVTAGVVSLPIDGVADVRTDWQCAVRLADWALYQGKAQGRNQARIVTRLAGSAGDVTAALDGGGLAEGSIELARVDGPPQDGG
jgi:diguanylate cyclase (GGDEF)-like protein